MKFTDNPYKTVCPVCKEENSSIDLKISYGSGPSFGKTNTTIYAEYECKSCMTNYSIEIRGNTVVDFLNEAEKQTKTERNIENE